MHDPESLEAYYDRELAGEARASVEAHLKGCADCREALAAWSRVARTLLAAPIVRASDRFVGAVMRRVDALERPVETRRARLPGWLVPSLALAASVFLFYVSLPAPAAPGDPELALLAGDASPAAFAFGAPEPKSDDLLALALERP